ncbi:MAG: hypothetical protein ABSD79_01590 [Dehalococcoidales bacterium]
MPTRAIDKNLLCLAGEFGVASNLCLKGYVASLTLKNYPKVDIFAFNPNNGKHNAIQVKTKLGGKEYFLPEHISDEDPSFVFVEFANKNSFPKFYIVPAKAVSKISEKERCDWIDTHPNAKKEQPRMISLNSLSVFIDKWENLRLD